MKPRHLAILISIFLAAWNLRAANLVDSTEFSRMSWVKQLMASNFNVNAPGINYPKFVRFCVNVYNWAVFLFPRIAGETSRHAQTSPLARILGMESGDWERRLLIYADRSCEVAQNVMRAFEGYFSHQVT